MRSIVQEWVTRGVSPVFILLDWLRGMSGRKVKKRQPRTNGGNAARAWITAGEAEDHTPTGQDKRLRLVHNFSDSERIREDTRIVAFRFLTALGFLQYPVRQFLLREEICVWFVSVSCVQLIFSYASTTPRYALDWEYRREIILRDIKAIDADIFVLQEVERGIYNVTVSNCDLICKRGIWVLFRTQFGEVWVAVYEEWFSASWWLCHLFRSRKVFYRCSIRAILLFEPMYDKQDSTFMCTMKFASMK